MDADGRAKTKQFLDRIAQRFPSLRDAVEDDVARVRGLTPEDVDERMGAMIRSAWRVMQELPKAERERLLRREPPAADLPAIWSRLHASYLAARRG